MQIISKPSDAYAVVQGWKRDGETVGLVPTMGFLHAGHLSLVAASRGRCQRTVVSIFVNPTQFGPQEDLASYPRNTEKDSTLLEQAGVDLLFLPSVEDMYPDGFTSAVEVSGLSEKLAGTHRPGHFRGVTTVCAKLFNVIPSDFGFFGQKDFQQVQILRRMVRDLNFSISIISCPTIRETDGLALSSRNAYLTADERSRAVVLSQAVDRAQKMYQDGERSTEALVLAVRGILAGAGEGFEIKYATVVDPESLDAVPSIGPGSVLLIEVYVGRTRLYDNCIFE